MERHSVLKAFHHCHLGEEKQEMLSLNRRLENYLNRVKLLEEENALLTKEIRSLRHSDQRALPRRKGLEEELRHARLAVDAAWRDRVHAELEVGRLTEELQALNLQRRREAQAHSKAKTMLEQSRKELEEEQRAQIWLREKTGQLEHEMRLLIQSHQEDVTHLEASLTHSTATVLPTSAQRANQTPNLQQLGQEFSQRATRAWQEAAEAYQGQLAQLEESLAQAKSRLSQVNQEKSESRMKLQTLQKDLASTQDVTLHLERTAAQQRARHGQEIQELQEHLESLEAEKEELGLQINHILLENQGLLQLKMSLGLEVATYRALLDSESLKAEISLLNQPGRVSDFCSRGMNKSFHRLTSPPAVCGLSGSGLTVITANPVSVGKPTTYRKPAPTLETTYPKIRQDGAVENFRPQEVYEKVAQAESLSPPNEPQGLTTPADGEDEEDAVNIEAPQVESGFTAEDTMSSLTSEPRAAAVESDKDGREGSAPKQEPEESLAPVDVWEENDSTSDEVEHVQEANSETEAVLEAIADSRTSSPVSEGEAEERVLNQPPHGHDDDTEKDGERGSHIGTNETRVEDKLYPDGEEMDTWDSVIERKADVQTDDAATKDGEKRQHAEPEEDISAKEPEHGQREKTFNEDVRGNDAASAAMDQQEDAAQQDKLSDKEDDDSQNVSVSWRTEVESDSYAQDNTLADTRPLIQYKSEETDNTRASRVEESELSEGDRETAETGAWSEGRRFGTMEDLCEEAEGDVLDEEYDLGYARTDVGDVGLSLSEDVASVRDTEKENEKDTTRNQNEGNSCEGKTEPTDHADVGDEELDTDRLVEEELDNLCSDSYSAHFALWQHRQKEGEEAGRTESGAMFPRAEPSLEEHDHPQPSAEVIHQPYEKLMAVPHTESLADASSKDAPEQRDEGDDHRHDEGEDDFNELRPEDEQIHNLEDSHFEQEDDVRTLEEGADTSSESQEQAAEWEKLEPGIRRELVPDSDEGYHHDDGDVTRRQGPEVSPVSVRDEEDSTELNDLHDVLVSGSSGEFTHRPDDACNQAAEQTHQDLGFGESLEKTSVLNGESRAGGEPGQKQFQLVHSEESEGESWSSGEEPV